MDPYAISDLSVAMSTVKVQNQVAESVLAKTIDITEQGGQALIDMMRSSMERSVNPAVGGNVDVSV
ncbi:MAG: YjfB family protein [Lachnospiraceae bacterium]|nr:YjfB family protein [Lachnospiraceae bacterium]